MGILNPTSGDIKIDGKKINDISKSSWWKQIGYIPQNPSILNGTIRDNIAFGFKNNQIEDSLVKKCLKQAQLLDFVESQPEGIDFKIEENGLNLSVAKSKEFLLLEHSIKNLKY